MGREKYGHTKYDVTDCLYLKVLIKCILSLKDIKIVISTFGDKGD